MKKTAQKWKLADKKFEKAALPKHQQKALKGGNGSQVPPPPADGEHTGTDETMDG
jgi:hypothetical protein